MSTAAMPAVIGRRACAVLAATSAVMHGAMLGHAAHPAMGVLMAGMAVACLYCAGELWMRGTLRIWVVVALMNLAMIALHLPTLGAHHHATAATAEERSTIMALATTVSLVEVGLAAGVLWFRTRRAAQVLSGKPAR